MTATSADIPSSPTARGPATSGYADVNGLHMYFEVHGTLEVSGTARPLVLLHGGMLTIELNFAGLIPSLAVEHQGIGAELQGHRGTADIDRPITREILASDVVALLDALGIEQADVFGH